MARIRTIKPTFFTSTRVAALGKTARLTFIGLWTNADDDGRATDDARLIKAAVWPLDDDMTAKKVEADLTALHESGLVERYEIAGRRYLRITGWREHQKINRPQASKLPASPNEPQPATAPPEDEDPGTADSRNAHGASTHNSPPERKGRERNREGEGNRERNPSSSTNSRITPEPDRRTDDDSEILIEAAGRAAAELADARAKNLQRGPGLDQFVRAKHLDAVRAERQAGADLEAKRAEDAARWGREMLARSEQLDQAAHAAAAYPKRPDLASIALQAAQAAVVPA